MRKSRWEAQMPSEETAQERQTYDFAEDHVAQLAVRSAKSLGGGQQFGQISPLLMQVVLDNALEATSPATGVAAEATRPWPSPIAEAPQDAQMARLLRDVLASERLWLQEHEKTWPSYGSAVVRVLSRDRGSWEHLSSRALEQVVSATTESLVRRDRAPRSIYDPLCGSGTLLAAAASNLENAPVRLCGQDVNEEALAAAERVLAIGGRASSLRADDLLETDSFPDDTFDLVVMDPPLGMRTDPVFRDRIESGLLQLRLPQGVPFARDQEWLFLALALQKVTPPEEGGGTLVAFLSGGALNRRVFGNAEFRRWLHEQRLLRAIVALPRSVRPDTGMGLYGLILSTSTPGDSGAKVQIIDLRGSFDTTRNSRHGRSISVSGENELRNALTRTKPSSHVRTVSDDEFLIDRFKYIAPTVSTRIDGRSADAATFTRNLPMNSTGWEWPLDQERDQSRLEIQPPPERLVDWSIDRFVNRQWRKPSHESWDLAPMLTLTKHLVTKSRSSATDGSPDFPWSDGCQVLILPLDEDSPVLLGDSSEVTPKTPSVFLELVAGVDGAFLASWLSSQVGIHSRHIARELVGERESVVKLFSGNAVVSLLANLLVPIPEAVEQAKVLQVHEAIETARRSLDGLSDELWANPQGADEIVGRLESFRQEEDLTHWSESLPYPIASALRAAQALEHDPSSQAKQVIHFWEASAQFFATYLMSALRGSDELWQLEIPRIRKVLSEHGNSFDRPSFGTWKVTIERLGSLFHAQLSAEDRDERQRAMELLGHPPRGVRDSLFSGELAAWISTITTIRNSFYGHAASMTAIQMAEHVRDLDVFTRNLWGILGSTWREFPLVRPHAASMGFRDGKFNVTVDVLVGPTSPFLPEVLKLNEPLEDSELYLVGSAGTVKLLPLVKIGRAPKDPGDTALFYNRRVGDGVRMVAYSFAAESDVTESDPNLQSLLDNIARQESTTVPGLQELDQ